MELTTYINAVIMEEKICVILLPTKDNSFSPLKDVGYAMKNNLQGSKFVFKLYNEQLQPC